MLSVSETVRRNSLPPIDHPNHKLHSCSEASHSQPRNACLRAVRKVLRDLSCGWGKTFRFSPSHLDLAIDRVTTCVARNTANIPGEFTAVFQRSQGTQHGRLKTENTAGKQGTGRRVITAPMLSLTFQGVKLERQFWSSAVKIYISFLCFKKIVFNKNIWVTFLHSMPKKIKTQKYLFQENNYFSFLFQSFFRTAYAYYFFQFFSKNQFADCAC